MKRLIVISFVLVMLLSCVPDKDTGRQDTNSLIVSDNVPSIFITGSELGALKPCGCSGGQLGGLDRRSEVFNILPRDKRIVIDAGHFVSDDTEQDIIKYNIMLEAFRLLKYDLVNFIQDDVEIAQNNGLITELGSGYSVVSPYWPADVNLPTVFTKIIPLKYSSVFVAVVALDTQTDGLIEAQSFFSSLKVKMPRVNVIILSTSRDDVIKAVVEDMPEVDCIIYPADSDDPRAYLGDPQNGPIIVSVGRYGRYVSRIKIYSDKPQSQAGGEKLLCPTNSGLTLGYVRIPVVEGLREQQDLTQLYKYYQQLVAQANLLEAYPKIPLPNNLKYMGSESCKECHEYEYAMWSTKAHASAYATLEDIGSQFDPECVICHVVGMDYDSGFISLDKTPHLKDVGCEDCHGPGSEHNQSEGLIKTTEPHISCLECHTPEHSTGYSGNEADFLEKIKHWKEPNEPNSVQQ